MSESRLNRPELIRETVPHRVDTELRRELE
jgi:hypothetical protein